MAVAVVVVVVAFVVDAVVVAVVVVPAAPSDVESFWTILSMTMLYFHIHQHLL